MPIHHISDLHDPRVALFRDVTDPELMRKHGLFVAEGRLVVKRLLESRRFETLAVLLTESVLVALRETIDAKIEACGAVAPLDTFDTFDSTNVFVVPSGGMELVGGFNFHRGCLALGKRPLPPTLADLALDASGPLDSPGPRIVLVLQSLANADNVGAIFRNAAAFGVHAVVLDGRSCDPLYRKATRTSMGATLTVPFATAEDWPGALDALRRAGYVLVALTPAADAIDIADAADAPELTGAGRRLALLVGSEGAGLDDETLARSDFRVAIRMAAGFDSLNVSTATGIALHRFARVS